MKQYVYTFISFMILLFASCSESPESEDSGTTGAKMVEVTFTTVSHNTATRAGEPSDNELINSWWVVFVDSNNKVARIVEKSSVSPTDNDRGNTSLSVGTYTVYAFANITQQELTANTSITITEGAEMPNLSSCKYADLQNGREKTVLVPMSGFLNNVTVGANQTNSFNIEVVRMLAKIEFQFTSTANSDIQVDAVKFLPLYSDAIQLLPNYSSLGSNGSTGTPSQPQTGNTVNFEYTFSNLTIAAGATEAKGDWFYALESQATGVHPTGYFAVQVSTTRNGEKRDDMYALTTLQHFYRNDHIVIPIVLTDYIVEPGVTFYPPIGGYPPVNSEMRNEECYITFGTAGDFEFYVNVRNGATGELLSASDVEVEIGTISDTSGILAGGKLEEDAITGRFIGRVTQNVGTAIVPITVRVKVNNEVKQEYSRTIYIIRKNA